MARARRRRQPQLPKGNETTPPVSDHDDDDDLSSAEESCGTRYSSASGSLASESRDFTPIPEDVKSVVRQQLIFSRVFLLCFQFFINCIMRDWPTDAFKGVVLPGTNTSMIDNTVELAIGGLAKWDARHFLHVAEHGYTWESELAFFPLLPGFLRFAGGFLHLATGWISLRSSMVIVGVGLSNVAFVVTGLILLELSYRLTRSLKVGIVTVYVFCWNPASVFFSSVYTESVYSMATFGGMLLIQLGYFNKVNHLLAAALFAFAFMARSNGLLNIGYLGYALLIEALIDTDHRGRRVFVDQKAHLICRMLKSAAWLAACLVVMAVPLRIFSYAIEAHFCKVQIPILFDDPSNSTGRIFPGDVANLAWCGHLEDSWLLPSYYAAVQEKYWNVGIFGYWQLRKLPFFLIAAPTIGFVFYGLIDLLCDLVIDPRRLEETISDSRMLIPFAIHSGLMALAGLFVYNVEVSIRLLFSCSPYISIVIARIMCRQTPRLRSNDDLLRPFLLPFLSHYARAQPIHFVMLTYLLGYYFIGTMMHVNWLPYV